MREQRPSLHAHAAACVTPSEEDAHASLCTSFHRFVICRCSTFCTNRTKLGSFSSRAGNVNRLRGNITPAGVREGVGEGVSEWVKEARSEKESERK